MKTNILFVIMSLLLASVCMSCYDDKGNYDYDWAPEVAFTTIRDTSVRRGDVLTITPNCVFFKAADHYSTVYQEIEQNPDDYTYSWIADKIEAGTDKTIRYGISSKQNLNDTIWLPIRSNPYQVTYTITDKKTQVKYTTRFNLAVTGRIYDGFFFLTENENKQVELDIYAKDAAGNRFLEKGMLERSGFPYRSGGANLIYYFFNNLEANRKLWIMTGEASGWLEVVNYSWDERYIARMIMAKQEPISYTFKYMGQAGTYSFFFTEAGNMHSMNNYGIISTDLGFSKGEKIAIYPQMATYTYGGLVYDKTNQRFMAYRWSPMTSDSDCSIISDPEAATGMELVYFQKITLGTWTIAIMKDPSGRLWKYTYVDNSRMPFEPKLAQNPVLLTNSDPLRNAEQIVIESTTGFIYFSVGNQLYVYRDGQGAQPVVMKDADGELIQLSHPIVRLQVLNALPTTSGKPAYHAQYNKSILVATYNSAGGNTGGTCYLFQSDPTESKNLTLYDTPITDLGKVKSATFMYR